MKSLSSHGKRDFIRSMNSQFRIARNSGFGLSAFIVIFVINTLRVPSGLLNFWAEDGVIFYSDVLNQDFPERLFLDSGGGGYLNLSGKIIAEIVGLLPIAFAPLSNFILVNLVYTVLSIVIYKRLMPYFQMKALLFLFMGFFIFVPIATFDSLATSINLHFFLLFTTAIIILAQEGRVTSVSHFIIFVTCLSDPLAILLLPAIVVSIKLKRNFSLLILTYSFSIIIQIGFIAHFFGDSTRVVGDNPNIIKTIYLFMDRVVGSSLIPNWGFIDGTILNNGGIPKVLIFRISASAIVLLLLIYLLLAMKILKVTSQIYGQKLLVGLLLLNLCLYWAVAGVFFNPEPRYAIFPSLCLVSVFLLSLDNLFTKVKENKVRQVLYFTTSSLFIFIFIFAFGESDFRNTDQIWSEQLAAGKIACKDAQLLRVEIRIPPEQNNLSLSINCRMLR